MVLGGCDMNIDSEMFERKYKKKLWVWNMTQN